jgi:hypothetical protein
MPAGIRLGNTTWKTDVATPPTLASMTKQQKEKAGKAINLGEFNQSCWGKETCRRDYPIRMKSDLKVIPKGLYDEGAAKGDDPHLTNGKRLIVSDRRESNITLKNKSCVQKKSETTRPRVPFDGELAEG